MIFELARERNFSGLSRNYRFCPGAPVHKGITIVLSVFRSHWLWLGWPAPLLLLGLGALFVSFAYWLVWPIIKTLVNGACSPHRPLQKRERTGKEYGCFPFA